MRTLDLTSLLKKAEIKEKDGKNICKGRFYRVAHSKFINKAGAIVFTTAFRPLKRKSCKGCEKCGWLDEDLQERNLSDILWEEFNQDDIVTVVICNEHTDWESGYVDDYDLKFVLVVEKDGL